MDTATELTADDVLLDAYTENGIIIGFWVNKVTGGYALTRRVGGHPAKVVERSRDWVDLNKKFKAEGKK